jgi:hypothetical protein
MSALGEVELREFVISRSNVVDDRVDEPPDKYTPTNDNPERDQVKNALADRAGRTDVHVALSFAERKKHTSRQPHYEEQRPSKNSARQLYRL